MFCSFAFRRCTLAGRFMGQRRFMLAAVLFCVTGGFLTVRGGMAVPVDSPAPSPGARPEAAPQPTTAPGGERQIQDVLADVDLQGRELAKVLPGLDSLFDENKRAQFAPKALPMMKKMADLLDEAIGLAPDNLQIKRARLELTAMMSLLGDAGGAINLRKLAVSTNEEEAAGATAWEYVVIFAHAGKDAEAQKKALTDLAGLARGNPSNDMIAQSVYLMGQQAANPEIVSQAERIITDVLKGPMAQRMAADLASEHKLRALEDKPLVIEGSNVAGGAFSSSDWKGKVVLVDFWATWCAPCMRDFSHIKKIFDQYHAKGLEVVGVSCDTDGDDLRSFLKVNPGISWPQLFDPKAAAQTAFHPIAEQLGVHNIPMLFLIDKKGIVRTVKAHENMDVLIPKMLEEKAD